MSSLNLFNNKIKVTDLGGIAVKLTNKTGGLSVAGEAVKTDTVLDDSVVLVAANGDEIIGLFLDDGIADGQEAWVVIAGISLVKADPNGYSKGDRIVISTTTNGRGVANNAPAVAAHFTEIGHALQDAAANSTARCVLHFN
jgi:hypothetical protein